MKKQYDQVKQFHAACNIEMPSKPTFLSRDSECGYFSRVLASYSSRIKSYLVHEGGSEVTDRTSYMLEELAEFAGAETIEDQVDALTDLIYFAIGTFTLMGVNPEPIFDIVTRANLGKVAPDGKVLRNAQGKIQKPDGWYEQYAPEQKIKEEIERQRHETNQS